MDKKMAGFPAIFPGLPDLLLGGRRVSLLGFHAGHAGHALLVGLRSVSLLLPFWAAGAAAGAAAGLAASAAKAEVATRPANRVTRSLFIVFPYLSLGRVLITPRFFEALGTLTRRLASG